MPEKGKKDDQKKVTLVKTIAIFPQSGQSGRGNTKFSALATGPNHAAAISNINGKAFVWGFNNL